VSKGGGRKWKGMEEGKGGKGMGGDETGRE